MSASRRVRSAFPTRELDYALPPELIAQRPPPRRDDARLLVVDRAGGELQDRSIRDLPGLLRPGDLLTLNDAKVVPAKFRARRASGGAVPGLFLSETAPGEWRVMLEGSRRLRPGETLSAVGRAGSVIYMTLIDPLGEGTWRMRIDPPRTAFELLDDLGQTPLPPYIRRAPEDRDADGLDRERYQTVYAKTPGAVAAPTAGFHLTPEILGQLRQRNIDVAFLTLHVGLGTFKPVTTDDLSHHVMHAERIDLPGATAEAVNACQRRGGRVVAVGTTSVRALEAAARADETGFDGQGDAEEANGLPGSPRAQHSSPSAVPSPHRPFVPLSPFRGTTDLLIYPPYDFRVVDALLTNFHLPGSTLLALVMAFAGVETTRRAYAHAIARHYRFYSFGDAMLIL